LYDRDGLSNGDPKNPFARVADHVAGQLERIVGVGERPDVLDDPPQLAVDEPRADAPRRPELILGAEDQLILELRLQILVKRRDGGQLRHAPHLPWTVDREGAAVRIEPVVRVQRPGDHVLRDDVILAVDGADVHVERNRLVEASPESVNLRLAVAERIPRYAEPRRPVVVDAEAADRSALEIDDAGIDVGVGPAADGHVVRRVEPLHLVAQPQIDGHVRVGRRLGTGFLPVLADRKVEEPVSTRAPPCT
jgi:hypothetical protein